MTAPSVETEIGLDRREELRAIVAAVRLRAVRLATWLEHHAKQEGWPDRWQRRDDRLRWSSEDERGKEMLRGLADVDVIVAEAPRLRRLSMMFGLDERERELLSVLLAATIDPSIASALAVASTRALPTEALIAELLDRDIERMLVPQSSLLRWDLVRRIDLAPGVEGLALDPMIADWFTGAFAIDEALVGIAHVVRPAPVAIERWPIDELVGKLTSRWNRRDLAPHARVIVVGPQGSGRRSFAASVAEHIGLGLVAISADVIDERVALRAHRQAYLTESALAFVGDGALRACVPRGVAPFPLVFAIAEPGELVANEATDIVIELPAPQLADRVALWRRAIPSAVRWSDGELDRLARQHRVLPGDVAHAAARGATSADEAAAVVRERGRGRLGELASRLECPFQWSDLVLSDSVLDLLRDFTFEASERAHVWENPAIRRLFPQGRGLFALLTGVPGTGKTMAAQTIAAELGLDLYRISLATVISKFVGETSKNLERILARAERMDAVLLFDEADALFGKRTEIKDAHDRYANSDTNHLLQAIESYSGIAILASNKKANLDPAFVRRLRYVVELPRPDAAQRRVLWERLVGELCGSELAGSARSLLDAASAIDTTGAQIKFAVLAALFAARRDRCAVGAPQLLRGLERELFKEGRSLSDRERERLLHA